MQCKWSLNKAATSLKQPASLAPNSTIIYNIAVHPVQCSHLSVKVNYGPEVAVLDRFHYGLTVLCFSLPHLVFLQEALAHNPVCVVSSTESRPLIVFDRLLHVIVCLFVCLFVCLLHVIVYCVSLVWPGCIWPSSSCLKCNHCQWCLLCNSVTAAPIATDTVYCSVSFV